MQGRGGGQQVRHGSARQGQETTIRRGLFHEPVSHPSVHRLAQMAQKGDRGRRHRGGTQLHPGLVGIGTVRCLQALQTTQQWRLRRALPLQVLPGPPGQEGVIDGAFILARCQGIAAVCGLKSSQTLLQGTADLGLQQAPGQRSPAAAKGRQVHKIKSVAVAESFQVALHPRQGRLEAEGAQTLQAKHRVVEIAGPVPISHAPIRVELVLQVGGDLIARFTQYCRSQPRDLQHFAPQTHCNTLPWHPGRRSCR